MSASLCRLAEDLLTEHLADLRWAAAELCNPAIAAPAQIADASTNAGYPAALGS